MQKFRSGILGPPRETNQSAGIRSSWSRCFEGGILPQRRILSEHVLQGGVEAPVRLLLLLLLQGRQVVVDVAKGESQVQFITRRSGSW